MSYNNYSFVDTVLLPSPATFGKHMEKYCSLRFAFGVPLVPPFYGLKNVLFYSESSGAESKRSGMKSI